MTVPEIMETLASLGSESTKNTLKKHGAKEPFFGVKIGDLKPLQKQLKKNYTLSKALYNTGNSDAMYLAGLIADEKAMTKADLQLWLNQADWYLLSEYIVAQLTAESAFGFELAKEWIESEDKKTAAAGWATLSNLVSIKPNQDLDIDYLSQLLDVVQESIHSSPNRVKYTMNGFVIAVGSFVPTLTDKAKATALLIGKVEVLMGQTSCKVPDALPYIEKIEQQGKIGKKKKMARC